MLGLPIEFSLKKAIKASGDSIGRVLEVDLSLLTKPYWMVTCVLVQVEMAKDMADVVDILVGDKSFSQLLDHRKIPFHCV